MRCASLLETVTETTPGGHIAHSRGGAGIYACGKAAIHCRLQPLRFHKKANQHFLTLFRNLFSRAVTDRATALNNLRPPVNLVSRPLNFVCFFKTLRFFVAQLSAHGYKRDGFKRDGPRQWLHTGAALTKNHLPKKGDSWLPVRLPVPINNVQVTTAFQRSKGRSWNWSKLTRTPRQFSFCLQTIPHSVLISIQTMWCFLSCQTGKRG